MTLIELQAKLKAIAETKPLPQDQFLLDEVEVANFNELTMYLNNIRQSATEIAQLIISAKIKQPKKPQPIKYMTENEAWTPKIENAYIEDEQGAKKTCDFYGFVHSRIIPHNGGFVITKPPTQ